LPAFVSLSVMNETILQQASMQGFIRTVLIIVGIWYAFKFLMRLLAPYLMKKMVQKAESNFRQTYEQQFGNTQNQYQNTNSNPTKSSKNQNPRSTKKIGEYIDYEEIE